MKWYIYRHKHTCIRLYKYILLGYVGCWMLNVELKTYKCSIHYFIYSEVTIYLWSSLYSVHRTLYTVHCMPYNVHHTVYTVHCMSYSIHRTVYNVHCMPYISAHRTLKEVNTLFAISSNDCYNIGVICMN